MESKIDSFFTISIYFLFFLLFREYYVDQIDPNVEGVYETQVPLIFRAYLQIGCVCRVIPKSSNGELFSLEDLEMTSIARQPYLLKDNLKHLYLYQHRASSGSRQIIALFITPLKKAIIIVVDSVRTNLMPNVQNLYQATRIAE